MRTITSISAAAILLRGPELKDVGVCNNLDMDRQERKEMVVACRELRWYSGDEMYPVEGRSEDYNMFGKWSGDRGEKRRQLCELLWGMSPYKDEPLFLASAHLLGILWHGPMEPEHGVCFNMGVGVNFDSHLNLGEFPEFTYDPAYPVEPFSEYEKPGKWDGIRRKRRMAFCRFLLSKFLLKMEDPT